MHSEKCTRSNLFIQLATRKTFKTQNWLHLNVSTTKDCEKIFLLNIRCCFSLHLGIYEAKIASQNPTFRKLIIEAACFLMPIIIKNHTFFHSALCFELQAGNSRSYFTGRKMSFSLRHSSAVYSFNKQNITFSFSIHTFFYPFYPLLCIWWQKRRKH